MLPFLIAVACSSSDMQTEANRNKMESIEKLPVESWQSLSLKKIFFGHQSVGYDIMNGIKDVMDERPHIELNLLEAKNTNGSGAPAFVHAAVGRNCDPKSKVSEFQELLDAGLGKETDIAFVKFCFVDLLPGSAADTIFDDYRRAMADLKQRFPRTTFVHVTVPLTSDEKGIKGVFKKTKDIIKSILGKTNAYDNTSRNMFNSRMRKEYQGREPVFDLAAIEATYPDGRQLVNDRHGIRHYSLIPEYTNDGGHLNKLGRKIVAEQLLIFLAKVRNP
jgi:hypothetical protein